MFPSLLRSFGAKGSLRGWEGMALRLEEPTMGFEG